MIAARAALSTTMIDPGFESVPLLSDPRMARSTITSNKRQAAAAIPSGMDPSPRRKPPYAYEQYAVHRREAVPIDSQGCERLTKATASATDVMTRPGRKERPR